MGTTGNINIYDGFNFCTTLEQSKQLLELGLNPETSDMTYLTGIRDGEEGDVYFDCYVNEDDLWMPVPTFDDILNSNKDVLKRLKEQ